MKRGKEELRREKEQESKKRKKVLGFVFFLFLQVERKEDEVDGRKCLKKKINGKVKN